MTPILVLAAGASARMAPRDKLVMQIGGEALLARTVRRALATGAPVVVVLPPDRPARAALLEGWPVTQVVAPDAAEGMAASLRAGVAAVRRGWPQAAGVMVLPADMPGPETADLSGMLETFARDPARILRGAGQDGTPGHPVIFPAALFDELGRLTGDTGGRPVIARHPGLVMLVPLPGDRAILDLDTPADWKGWRDG